MQRINILICCCKGYCAQSGAFALWLVVMGIESVKNYSLIAGIALLSFGCKKEDKNCLKEGISYTNTSSFCWYSPNLDSIPIGSSFTLEAALPKTFIDENKSEYVVNSSDIVMGSLAVVMIHPIYQASVDSFELTPQVGKIMKDSINFTQGMLKGFRTVQWDASSIDSFRMKISIKPLAKGVYFFAFRQQSSKDKDCALYKYFLKIGSDQHLHYWAEFNNGVITDDARSYAYCFKVY